MSTFQFQAPLPPPSPTSFSASSDGGIDPDASTDAFYSLLLDCPEMNSSIIESLSNKLLSIRINRSLSVEMKLLESELREEWRIRTGGLKADWMARFVPSHQEDEEEEVEQEEEGGREKEMLQPTIISDVDSRIEMENKVDTLVEKEFNERIEEAQELFINQISSREKLELEIFLGELLLEAREEEDEDEDITKSIIETLRHTLITLGESPDIEETEVVEGINKLTV